MIGQTLAHYRITAKLGEGGMGEVYRAHDTHLDREVALKILPRELSGDPERAARFEREARTLASLQHPNIASIYGYQQAEGTRFLAMELVEGEDLAERLRRGPLRVDEAVRIASQIAVGMEAAHERNIVHRDLKPANVRIDPEGTVKILDFGLARAYSGDSGDNLDLTNSPTITAAMTQMGVILGTAAYMSPEQARAKPIDKRSDIWSYGVILHEMLTGKQLYRGETVTDILGAIVHRAPDLDALPPDLPSGLRRLIQRCLTPDAAERLRDIGEARFALAHLEDAPAAAVPKARGGGRLAWAVSLVLLAVLVAMSIRLLQPPPPPPVIQASISLPPGHALRTLGSLGGSMRFSPDGRSITFVVQSSGASQIWVRSLDERQGRPVQGTEGGHRPFWSPDGKSLGFFFRGSMRRVSVEGGAPLTIAAAADGRGGAWLPDGTIVFAPTPSSGLFAVPAAGGEPRPVTQPGRFTHREPRALGSNGDFLFLENRNGGQWWVSVGNADGRDHEEVTLSGGGVGFAQGHLLFLRGSTLVTQPFDPGSRRFTGEAVPLAENVIRDLDYGIGAFAASEQGGLVYQAGQGSEARLVILDRDGNHVRTIGEPGAYSQIALSPNEKTVATLLEESDGGSDFWMMDLERGTRQRFTFTPEGVATRRTQPCWTPDGRRLIYTLENEAEVGIYSKPTDGSGVEELLLVIPGEMLWVYDISPDGQWVLFGRESVGTGRSAEDLWLVPVSGESEPRALLETPFDEWPGNFSPDGRWVAIDSDESGRREVYVVSFPDPRGKWQVSRAGGRFPQWNGDGTELYYQDPEGGLVAVPVDASGETFVAGDPQRLFQAFMISGSTSDYYAMHAGDGFLMVEQALQEAPISLFLNWKEALAAR